MKKSIRIFAFGLLLTSVLLSCDHEDFADRSDVRTISGYANLTDRKISIFDNDATLNLKLFKENSTVSFDKIDIVLDSVTSTTAAVTNDTTAAFNSSFLGALKVTSYGVTINSTLSNGNITKDNFTINSVNPVSISKDNVKKSGLDTLGTVPIDYSTYTFSAPKNNVVLSLKKNKGGTYTASGAGQLDVNGGTVLLKDTNYKGLNLAAKDSLYYQFTITSGTKSSDAAGYIVVAAPK